MKSIDKIRLGSGSTVREAMIAIDDGAMKIAVVVDEEGKLVGILTDGDIRRGLIDGMTLSSSIEKIIQTNPIVCFVNDSKEDILAKSLGKKIYHVPVLDANHRVVGIEDIDTLLASQT
ncbi:MAG: CBS domain-containing protein, partial [Sulfurimonas sp.]|nr:CBS domain-containing protein [Sulfurimonas sp.]